MSRRKVPLTTTDPILLALAAAIDASGLKQADIARRAGYSQSVISRIRQHDYNPRVTMLRDICEVVGLTLTLTEREK